MTNAPASSAAAAVLGLVFVAGCGADAETKPEPTESPSTSESSEPATPIELSFGESTTVTWLPTEDLSGDLDIEVDAVREANLTDFRDLAGPGVDKNAKPWYVDVVLTNTGDADFGGLEVPLYLRDGSGVLGPPWHFGEPFKPCESVPLPDPFAFGDEAKTCLVFITAPGEQPDAVIHQAGPESPAVIWTGKPMSLKEQREAAKREKTQKGTKSGAKSAEKRKPSKQG